MNEVKLARVNTSWLICVGMFVAVLSFQGPQLAGQELKSNSVVASPGVSASKIPTFIQIEAKRRGVELSSIKLQGEYWVACEGEDANAACIVLGKVISTAIKAPEPVRLTGLTASSVLEVHQYGQAVRSITAAQKNEFGQAVRGAAQGLSFELKPGVEARVSVQGKKDQVIDTLPRFRREGDNLVRTKDLQLVRETIDARPNEPFAVIVTVPALCEPCRRLDKLVHDNVNAPAGAGKAKDTLRTKLFILEYFTFADAERELLGTGAVFPTTLVFGVEPQPRKSISRLIGNMRGSSMDDIARPLAEKFRRGTPHTMSRGVVMPDLLFQPQDARLTQR